MICGDFSLPFLLYDQMLYFKARAHNHSSQKSSLVFGNLNWGETKIKFVRRDIFHPTDQRWLNIS